MAVAGTERKWDAMPPALARKLKARRARIADGYATALGASDALRQNRVVGLGHRGRASARAVDDLIAFYAAAGVPRFSVMVSPGPQRAQVERWLEWRGFVRHGGDALLRRDARTPLAGSPTWLPVRRARANELVTVEAIFARAFAMPASRREWSLAALRVPGIEHSLAFAGERPVAACSLSIQGAIGWLSGAATLTKWRRRGAQSALIAARVARARRAGCRWLGVETAEAHPGRPDGSRRNLLRLGFEQVAVKPVYVWTR